MLVSYSRDENKKDAFLHLPKTIHDAYQDGYTSLDPAGAKCEDNGIGYRFIKNDDPTVVPIYNENGYIVGIENGFAESQIKTQKAKDWFKKQHFFNTVHPANNKSETIYYIRVYFNDPG
uniref:Uncharacterized protein n=1 Tax=Strigamia maritima TaxID=126957 RepID=T1IJP5_STRMM